MFCTLLFVLSLVSWSQQHLSYPINYCNMASTCIHDSRVVCASSPDGCSRRSFMDQCDMYEYNCDYGARYIETYILFCSTLDMSPQNNLMDASIETSPNCDEKVNDKFISLQLTYFNSKTTPETKSDSASPTLLTKKLTLKSTEIINNTKYCCNRPKIWGKTTKMGAFNKNKSIEDSDTEYKNEVKDEKARLLLKENYTQTNDTANYTSNQFNFISPTAKKVVITQETVVSNIKMSSNRVLAKRPKKNLLTPSMFCNYHKCQRPLNWITTSKSKKRKLV
ncbi:uncharacterized protein LOC126776395 isoform X1 [Nymphalis io]|uniref:uncharacterized protein LOC126776395 isoform X1 n=1 Tax=Inachis io TaxID=171585 RepID=UPI00216A41D1|nr:uncharacterized protein LOC126776395 isoform X1 [Nymphalis io]